MKINLTETKISEFRKASDRVQVLYEWIQEKKYSRRF